MLLLHKLTGNEGEFIKEYKPTGKPLTTQIRLNNGDIYYAPSTEFVSRDVNNSIQNYKKFGIEFEIDGDVVKVFQKRLFNGYILNQKQLIERAKKVFPDAKIQPNVYSLDLSEISVDWINERMDEFGIKRNDLVKQLALDKSYISRLFGEGAHKIELTRQVKAMFYYYFLTYELNRDFRENLI